jgi:hypothetical protein
MNLTSSLAHPRPVTELFPRADRGPHRRRLAAYLAWGSLGALGGFLDKIHERLGVVTYLNKEWIGERLPISPMYVAAGLAGFFFYTLFVGHRGRQQGLLGGRPLELRDSLYASGAWLSAYALSGLLASNHLPWLASGALVSTALPGLWSTRRTWLLPYALFVGLCGVSAEWLATASGGYAYPSCPSAVCAGTTVPVAWLGPLYLHAALLVHRLLGGRHWFSRQRGVKPNN